MTERKVPPYPVGVSGRGARFWRETHRVYQLEPDETLLLVEVCRLVTLLDQAAETIARDGPMSVGAAGQPVAHPAIAAADRMRPLLMRAVAQLALPHPDGKSVPTGHQVRGQAANAARWSDPEAGATVSEMMSRAAMARWHPSGDRGA